MRRGPFLLVLLVLLVGCASFTSNDERETTHAAVLAGMAYAHEDASTPAAALMRGSYCASADVAKRHTLKLPDAGIVCELGP